MGQPEFFQQVKQIVMPWSRGTICFPLFYYDVATLSAQFLAPISRVKAVLPSARMQPLRVTPWHCVVAISAFEYRDSDIGAYNEVSIGLPFVLDEPSPLWVGTLRKPPSVPQIYVHHLPVTTAIACDAGIEFAGYPKFLAEITFERDGKWIKCHLHEANQHILTLTGQEGPLKPVPRSRVYPFTVRAGHLLRCELVVSERQMSSMAGGVLVLGEHAIAQELQNWQLGKMLACQFAPNHQAILTPVIESWAISAQPEAAEGHGR